MEFIKTQIEVLGITFMEPMAVSTDILISFVCLYAFIELRKLQSSIRSVSLFSWYFLLLSIGTAFGGIVGHAFIDLLSFEWKIPGWIISMCSVTLLSLAVIHHAKPYLNPDFVKSLILLCIVELLIMIPAVLSTMDFLIVEVHASFGLLGIVLALEFYVYSKTRQSECLFMIIAVAISAVAAAVHLSGFMINRWFNHLDLSHLIMAVSAYVFFLAAKRLEPELREVPEQVTNSK